MPFPNQQPRLFNFTQVSELGKNQNGVYGLFRQNQWVYIGKGDIRQRLLDHLNGDNKCILQKGVTHFVYEVTANSDAREKQLIIEFDPPCNKQIG